MFFLRLHLKGGGWYLDLPSGIILAKEQTLFEDYKQKVNQQQEVRFSIEHMPPIVTQFEFSKWPPKSKKKNEPTPTIVDCLDEICSSKQ